VNGTGPQRCAGFVLAGGASSRFLRDKALVTFGDMPLLARLCRLVAAKTQSVAVIGAAEKYAALGTPCVADQWPGEGPLGGIVTALESTAVESDRRIGAAWNLIVGCDMPFLTREWLEYLIELAAVSSAEVVVPKSDHGLEPLCACWRTDVAPKLRRCFEQGTRRVTDAMKHLRMEVLDGTHWKRFDSAGRLFWNMNTPADYEQARRILEAERA
jgi:molybdenum cofactor guanylyltransferase